MKLILVDHPDNKASLTPFTLTRPIGEIRLGIGTLREKWEWISGLKVSTCSSYSDQHKKNSIDSEDCCFMDSSIIPDQDFFFKIKSLLPGQALVGKNRIWAARTTHSEISSWKSLTAIQTEDPLCLDRNWNIFQLNGQEIRKDFALNTRGRKSFPITDPFTKIYAPENIFVEEGAIVRASIINAESGPVYLGKNSQIMEGSVIRGPFVLGEHGMISMGTVIRGETTVGPYCRVGGEINNSVFFSHSNKAHHGFLGNSVIGSWCNLGAGTSASNLKNNFRSVKIWSGRSKQLEDTGLQFCGLMMGDYVTSAINTSFNTATWVGCGARVLGAEFPPVFIPPFVQGGAGGFRSLPEREILDSARRFFKLKNIAFSEQDKNSLSRAYALALEFRNSELEKIKK